MIYNITRGNIISHAPVRAKSFCMRARGMIGRNFAKTDFDAMIFENCSSVHSCFMSTALDIVFIDSGSRVTDIRKNFAPWQVACGRKGSAAVIELPPGTADSCGISCGDILNLNSFLSPEEVEKFQAGAILNKTSFKNAEQRLLEQPLKQTDNREL